MGNTAFIFDSLSLSLFRTLQARMENRTNKNKQIHFKNLSDSSYIIIYKLSVFSYLLDLQYLIYIYVYKLCNTSMFSNN